MTSLRPEKLDHVALYVSDPDAVAARILAQLPFREIERTDEFVLIGRGPEFGKLTLFLATGPRERGSLDRIGIGIPCGTVERTIDVGEGLELELVPANAEGEVELDHVSFVTPDPAASARSWREYGFELATPRANGATRMRLGDSYVELHRGSPVETDRPFLNHLGLLVESVDEVRQSAEDRRLRENKFVDAENSRAVFLGGPNDIELEYIEHKPSFALA